MKKYIYCAILVTVASVSLMLAATYQKRTCYCFESAETTLDGGAKIVVKLTPLISNKHGIFLATVEDGGPYLMSITTNRKTSEIGITDIRLSDNNNHISIVENESEADLKKWPELWMYQSSGLRLNHRDHTLRLRVTFFRSGVSSVADVKILIHAVKKIYWENSFIMRLGSA